MVLTYQAGRVKAICQNRLYAESPQRLLAQSCFFHHPLCHQSFW